MNKDERLYIAGPNCFWPRGNNSLAAMREYSMFHGFYVALPGDPNKKNDEDAPKKDWSEMTKKERGASILKNCADSMNDSTCIIANLDNYRGFSPDGGTIFEIGMAYAKDCKCYAYTRDKRSIGEKYTGVKWNADTIIDETLYRGFIDALTGDTTHFNSDKAKELFREKQQVNKDAKVAKLTEAGRKFLAENKKRDGIITTPSGLQYEVLTQGEGEVPQKTDKVKVHYEGRLIDGTVFDASSKHGTEPSTFRPDQVIKGWTEALTMMPVGSKWRLYIPQELAYGERQAGQIPPYSTLIFDVELVGIDK